ncbi:MAG: phage tail tip lysozyme [Rhizobiaceae bacterium]
MSKFDKIVAGYMTRLINDLGVTVLDSAAVFGNAGHECNGFETLQEIKPTVKGSAGGYGWFQWTGPRRRAFMAFCKKHNLKPHDDEANYLFLVHELRTSEKGALAKMAAARTLKSKVVAFELGFERAGVKHYPSRQKWAERALAAYNAAKTPKTSVKANDAPASVPVREPKPVAPAAPPVKQVDGLGIPDLDKPLLRMTTIWGAFSALLASITKTFADLPPWASYVLLAVIVGGIGWMVRERLRRRDQQRDLATKTEL